MGGRREVSIIFYRPVTRSDLKQERSFFRGSVSSFLQLVVEKYSNTQILKYSTPIVFREDVLTCAFSYGLNMGEKTQVKSFQPLSIIFLPCAVSYLKLCVMYMHHLCG